MLGPNSARLAVAGNTSVPSADTVVFHLCVILLRFSGDDTIPCRTSLLSFSNHSVASKIPFLFST